MPHLFVSLLPRLLEGRRKRKEKTNVGFGGGVGGWVIWCGCSGSVGLAFVGQVQSGFSNYDTNEMARLDSYNFYSETLS